METINEMRKYVITIIEDINGYENDRSNDAIVIRQTIIISIVMINKNDNNNDKVDDNDNNKEQYQQ